jgi:hypothetical protein
VLRGYSLAVRAGPSSLARGHCRENRPQPVQPPPSPPTQSFRSSQPARRPVARRRGRPGPALSHGPSHPLPRFAGVAPSAAAHEELTWFFNEALRDLEGPPPADAPRGIGLAPGHLWPFEALAEVVHAAAKIHARLRSLDEAHVRVLDALYTETMSAPVVPLLARDRRELARARGAAILAYERARGAGPSVVPELDPR